MADDLPRSVAAAEIVVANRGVGELRTGLDLHQLMDWLTVNVDGFRGPLEASQFKGGQSNPTYRLSTPGRFYVLRRKPPGEIVKGAHDVLREARVQQALAGSEVPVARVLAICDDDSVIGSQFYVMDLIEGRVFWDAAFIEVPIGRRAAYYDEMSRVIAALHMIDYRAVGLSDFGRPGNYFARQISRWSRQYLKDEFAGRNADMDALVEWLPAAIPEGNETTIVHGDFRCDNLVFHPTEPRILTVLDWELSTLGHPLADFTYHAMVYRMPPDIVAGLGGADPVALGLPTEDEYIVRYCERTGRSGIPHRDFYIAFQFFRLAAIFHGIKGRVLRGTASNAQAAQRAEAFPRLATLARQAMETCK